MIHQTTNGFVRLLLDAPPAASREDVISILEMYAATKTAADIRRELPKKTEPHWPAVHTAIHALGLEAAVLRLATGIEAQEQTLRRWWEFRRRHDEYHSLDVLKR